MRSKATSGLLLGLIIVMVLGASLSGVEAQAPAELLAPQGGVVVQEDLGTAFTYQGRLTDGGAPADGIYDLKFTLHPSETGGALMSTATLDDVTVSEGLFTVLVDFGHGSFRGDARWIEIAVRPGSSTGSYTTLSPRQALTPAPHALTMPGLYILQSVPSPSLVGGYNRNYIHSSVEGGTIGGGGRPDEVNTVRGDYGTVSGGVSNTVTAEYDTIGGGWENLASGGSSTIAGGQDNRTGAVYSTVGGGAGNTAGGRGAVVAGGGGWAIDIDTTYPVPNTASGNHSTISGGGSNSASAESSTVSGGMRNTASGEAATIGGGFDNTASGYVATVAGGGGVTVENAQILPRPNKALADWSTVGGGGGNEATGEKSTVAGGYQNAAKGEGATVGGGDGNLADGKSATVAGGGGWFDLGFGGFQGLFTNRAQGELSSVGGGGLNSARGASSTVGGGFGNEAAADKVTISGGANVTVTGEAAAVGGGEFITVTGGFSSIGGGKGNAVLRPEHDAWESRAATVGGGEQNTAREAHATVGGGANNVSSGYASTVGGGGGWEFYETMLPEWIAMGNSAVDRWSTVGGGGDNYAGAEAATIAGGTGNTVRGRYGFIGGGGPESGDVPEPADGNKVTDNYGVVGGGTGNEAGDDDGVLGNSSYNTVCGGKGNHAWWEGATVGGGVDNGASGIYSTVGGGHNNAAGMDQSTVSGGESNQALGIWATVGGGTTNVVEGIAATIAGGAENAAPSQNATVGGGTSNHAAGDSSTVPGGAENLAEGQYSFAAGYQGRALHNGSFVWCDTFGMGGCETERENEFHIRATGGVRILTGITEGWAGARLRPGGSSWETISDRNAKENFEPVDGREVLEKLAEIPISTWNYKTEEGAVRHMGPMAQDFYAAFGVGADNKHLTTIDPDGVALASVQGLYELVEEQETQIETLESRLEAAEARLQALEARDGEGDEQPRLPMTLGAVLGAVFLGAVLAGRDRVPSWGRSDRG